MIQILLVDDSQLMRRYVARTLEMTGIPLRIHEAADGSAAMDKARAVQPDLIITDLNMPGMSGDELTALIANDPRLHGTPVLVLSADHSANRPEELLHVGAVAYLTKPVAPETLRDRLLQIVELRSKGAFNIGATNGNQGI